MDYLEHWHSIAARVRGLITAARLHASFLHFSTSDTYNRSRYLSIQCLQIFSDLKAFSEAFRNSMPPEARIAIDAFLTDRYVLFKGAAAENSDIDDEKNRAVLVLLAALETQITYLLSDAQPAIKARSELAFSHLQRSIVADLQFRAKWQAAFRAGEVACEALGAVHLLSHGLYAFKISAIGGTTDLVFQEPVEKASFEPFAGLVLTEWKKASGAAAVPVAFEAAKRQAELYAPGALSGNELKKYRYAVVVSDDIGISPPDIVSKGIIYRSILICVKPVVPSKQARLLRRFKPAQQK